MKRTWMLLLFLALLLMACNETSNFPSPQMPSSPAQKLVVDTAKDTLIRGEEGILIEIPSNAFVNSSGKVVEGPVDLEIKELVKPHDILLHNLSTTASEGLLETRGMIEIKAWANGERLQLGNGKSIGIAFPNTDAEQKPMQLFYGMTSEQGVIEWELAELEVASAIEENIEIIKKIDIRYRLEEDLDNRNAYFRNNRGGEELLDSLLTFTEEEQMALLGTSFSIYWVLFADGDLEVYEIKGLPLEEKRKAIESQLNGVPFVKPFKREGETADLYGWINVSFYDKPPHGPEDPYYSFLSNRLGWINCDIFINFDVPKINMAVNAPEGSQVKLLFKNYDIFVTAYQNEKGYYFSNLPDQEPVRLVVIRPQEEQYEVSFTDTYVSTQLDEMNAFETLSLEELKVKLDQGY